MLHCMQMNVDIFLKTTHISLKPVKQTFVAVSIAARFVTNPSFWMNKRGLFISQDNKYIYKNNNFKSNIFKNN